MPIDFTPQRWEELRKTYRAWWAGELRRPLVQVVELNKRDPGRAMPAAPLLSQANCADLSVPAEDLVDRIDWEMSRQVYLGDAYPIAWELACFGPGVMAAFLGAKLDTSTGQVWFHPPREVPIADLHLEYDAENVWLGRVWEICVAMVKRWQGQVLIAMPDLGGNLDVLSTFRPGEQLLLDLYDHPEEVRRVLGEVHELWHRFFAEINAILQPSNPGYSSWCAIYSDRPYYILQCDFCYMISPDMFKEFVLPELDATTKRLGHSFYHLDGKGQLPHLDVVLSLERLDGVQWVPGEGAPPCPQWPEVYERILGAGKKTQLRGKFAEVYALLQRTGVGAGVHYPVNRWDRWLPEGEEIQRWIDRFAATDFSRKRG